MKDYRKIAAKLNGPLVPVLAAFDSKGNLDIESICRWIDWLIDKGIRLFWTTTGTSHFFCLSEKEILELTKALAEVISGRAIYISSTAWDWSTGQCREFVEYSAKCGVDIVKLEVDWRWQPTEKQVVEHYREIAASSSLPLMAYTVGVRGTTGGMSNDLLRSIIELPQFVGLKNDSGDYDEQGEYLRVVRTHSRSSDFAVMTGGGMKAFLLGYEFGARAYGDFVAWVAPDKALAFSKFVTGGKTKQAVQIIADWEEPMLEQCGRLGPAGLWRWGHNALYLMGYFKSAHMRFPLRTSDRKELEMTRKFLKEKGVLNR